MIAFVSEIVAIFFATLAVSVLFNTPKNQMLLCGLTGAIGWTAYRLALMGNDSVIIATFVATIVVTVCSRVLSIVRKTPITIFLISGIIPFVPGSGVYYTMYDALVDNNESYLDKGIETLRIAGTIAVAIMIVLSLPMFRRRR